ncbi:MULTISPECIES: hypothetical protein [Salimicrobium]|uniref:Uncharacterized protein n=2 Tax=Salimicrobium TaxID=351195 RepID=K2G9E2_9BACI|nr:MULTISPECIES: hypothetical protein [Salimicrobium]EKE31658.1 hypothetical protein MJ3_07753 [Salimicrobium jeotgali]MBM7696480.1 hypothetical protein [Salimicrobium jeotgali]SDX45668.1 hypothetical protein SAMN04488081_0577 [Salimicrobium album]
MIKKIGAWIGTIAGVALGGFLYGIEKIFGLSVYTLLMNVDFIPGVRHAMGHPALEWMLHLSVSLSIGFIFVYIVEKRKAWDSTFRFVLSGLLSAGAALTYVPLTLLAIQETPSLRDGKAISLWLAGHAVFGLVLSGSYDVLKWKDRPAAV